MIWQVITGVFVIAIVYMLVRPTSPAATVVTDTTDALAAFISAAVRG